MTLADESAFLELVTESCERRCREALDAAREDARTALRVARAEARQRVVFAIEAQRSRERSELSAVRAELKTRLRLVVQHAEQSWLELAWPELSAALEHRWKTSSTRARWIAAALDRAEAMLEPDARFRIEHPVDLAPAELEAAARPSRELELAACAAITGGIRIVASGATLDATIEGLLRRADLIQGRLLAALEGSKR
jgi:hypothetical protein